MVNLIFDFDGTLVDSFQCAVSGFNQLSDQFMLQKIDLQNVNALKDMTSKELIKYLRVPLYKLPFFIAKARTHMHDNIHTLSPVPHLNAILHQFAMSGHTMGILTTNSLENVASWLHQNQISHLFQFIYNDASFFGKTKMLKKLLKEHQINHANAYYIGDETRDIDAAKKCNIYSVAVTWGFNSEKILQQSTPDYLVRSPQDLLHIFDKKADG